MKIPLLLKIRKSITYKLTVAFVLLIITPVCIIGYLSFRFSETVILEKVGISTSKTLEQTAVNVDNLLNGMISVANTFNLNRDIVEILDRNSLSLEQNWRDATLIDNLFVSIHSTFFPYNSYFTITSATGKSFTSWDTLRGSTFNVMNQNWFKQIPNNRFSWFTAQTNYVHEERSRYPLVFTLAGSIQENIGQKVYGKFLISIPHQELITILKKATVFPESSLVLLDDANRPFIHTGQIGDKRLWAAIDPRELMDTNGSLIIVASHQKYLINYQRLNKNAWKVAEIIPYESLLGEIRQLGSKIGWVLCLFILLFVVIAILIAISITRPIKQLCGSMRKVEDGDLTVQVRVISEDEVGLLVSSFNKMVKKIKELIDQLVIEQRRERELEFEALQAQIRPHFLFNTLNSIRWVAVMNQADSVADMISALSQILKMSINSNKFITIQEELEGLKSYLLLQQVRYNSRLEVSYEIDPAVLQLPIIKLILQPLVENAIIHGLAKSNEGMITVIIHRDGETVIAAIRDNGRGMPSEKVAELNRLPANFNQAQRRGIGLSNVQQRLQLNYGDQAKLTIDSQIGSGTVVTLSWPLLSEEAGNS